MANHIPSFLIEKRSHIYQLADKYGVSNIRVFGSQVRGDQHEDSDVDLLVHFDAKITGSGFSFLRFKREAEELLNKRIDIVLDGGLSPYIGPYIIKEALPL